MPTLADLTEEQQIDMIDDAQADPAGWVRDTLGNILWSQQIKIMESVRDHKETAVKSCHGIGKDFTAARVVLWYLYNFVPSIVITTGPTARQVYGILWKEIAVAWQRSQRPLGGRLLQQRISIAPNWWAWGFTAPEKDPDKFQGFHEENILVVIDEASGVSEEIYTAIDGILTSQSTKKLEIGNPTDPSSRFAQSFVRERINKITVSAFDTPNFTTFGITIEDIINNTWEEKIAGRKIPCPYLVTPEWVRARYEDWGIENPMFVSRVLGQFPAEGVDTLIPLARIEAAQNRILEPVGPNVLGVDIARFGDDLNVIAHRHGPVLRIRKRFGKTDTMTTTGHVIKELTDTKAEIANVDVIGIGSGVVDRLAELDKPVAEASAGTKSSDPELFKNARAEWFWGLRTRFEQGDIDLDPADESLAAQLASLKWKPNSRGQITIEAKEDMKKRGLPSPNDADATAIAFAKLSRFSFSFASDYSEEEQVNMQEIPENQGEGHEELLAKRARVMGPKQTPAEATDLLVQTSDPKALQKQMDDIFSGSKKIKLVRIRGIDNEKGPRKSNGCYTIRVIGDYDYVATTLKAHGFAEVVDIRHHNPSEEKYETQGGASGNLVSEDLLDSDTGPLMGAPDVSKLIGG